MRKKLSSEAGFSLVELLAVTVILALLGLMLGTGLNMALTSYRTVVAQSEVELLLSTAIDALADDLRYAREYTDGSPVEITYDGESYTAEEDVFTYTSGSYGYNAYFTVDSDEDSDQYGQIIAMGKETDEDTEDPTPRRVLSTGAHGLDGAYRVTSLTITPNDDNTFTICLTVATADGKITASTPKAEDGNDIGVTVRCLNKMTETTT